MAVSAMTETAKGGGQYVTTKRAQLKRAFFPHGAAILTSPRTNESFYVSLPWQLSILCHVHVYEMCSI